MQLFTMLAIHLCFLFLYLTNSVWTQSPVYERDLFNVTVEGTPYRMLNITNSAHFHNPTNCARRKEKSFISGKLRYELCEEAYQFVYHGAMKFDSPFGLNVSQSYPFRQGFQRFFCSVSKRTQRMWQRITHAMWCVSGTKLSGLKVTIWILQIVTLKLIDTLQIPVKTTKTHGDYCWQICR